jgi:hypothetical protein
MKCSTSLAVAKALKAKITVGRSGISLTEIDDRFDGG